MDAIKIVMRTVSSLAGCIVMKIHRFIAIHTVFCLPLNNEKQSKKAQHVVT